MGRPVHRPDTVGKGAHVIFEPGDLHGVVIISPSRHTDDRGFFARTWCSREFAAAGLPSTLVQSSVSWNERKHTLRGMHWEALPQRESKLVRCTRGAIFDVVVDLRPESPSYLEHLGVRLAADDHRAVFIPPGMGHGFLTLADGTEVLYQMDSYYVPEAERGARWDDPAFGIDWPAHPAVISERDRSFTDFVVEAAMDGTPCRR
jgi:dTDP-4-dehydrorhamnose 3,5-epimerase